MNKYIHLMLLLILFVFCHGGQLCAQKTVGTDSLKIPTKSEKRAIFRKSLIAPAALFLAGGLAATDNNFWSDDAWADARNEKMLDFHTNVDDWLMFVPMLSVYGLNLAGVQGRNSFGDRTAILLKAELLSFAIITPMKMLISTPRPDGSNNESFPSGHTAQAFIGATFLHREYGHLSAWYSIGGYVIASSVGMLRIMNNKHYLSDVLVGAGIGVLTTNIAYLTHGYRWAKAPKNFSLLPTYGSGRLGFYASLRL